MRNFSFLRRIGNNYNSSNDWTHHTGDLMGRFVNIYGNILEKDTMINDQLESMTRIQKWKESDSIYNDNFHTYHTLENPDETIIKKQHIN